MRKALSWLVALTLLGIVSGCGLGTAQEAITNFGDARGAATKEQVVQLYVQALERSDADAIMQLIPATHSADQEVRQKITALGGYSLQQMHVEYLAPVGPWWVRVPMQGSFTNEQGQKFTFTDELNLQKFKDHWCLMLGRDKNGIIEPPTLEALPQQPTLKITPQATATPTMTQQ